MVERERERALVDASISMKDRWWGFRVCLVRRIKKWEGKKWGRGWENERIENILFFVFSYIVWLER